MIGATQQRIRVEGFNDSDVHLKVILLHLKTGQVSMAIEGCEPSVQNLVKVRELIDGMLKEIDRKLPAMVQADVRQKQLDDYERGAYG